MLCLHTNLLFVIYTGCPRLIESSSYLLYKHFVIKKHSSSITLYRENIIKFSYSKYILIYILLNIKHTQSSIGI